MAATTFPLPPAVVRDEVTDHESPRGWLAWVAAALTLVLTAGAAVGLSLWGWAALSTPVAADPVAAEAVISAGQPPAVAATGGGRIVDVGCMVTGRVPVAPDGSGAFTVLGGARHVDCPQEEFQSGMTLRWPPDATPATVARGNP